jgi:hypothetical protein
MTDFQSSYEGIGEMLRSAEMQAEMRRRAEAMLAFAQADAPYDPTDTDGDHYRDHFSVESGIQVHKTTRAYGALVNDHPAALPIEVGTSDTPAHHTLTRALDAAGD